MAKQIEKRAYKSWRHSITSAPCSIYRLLTGKRTNFIQGGRFRVYQRLSWYSSNGAQGWRAVSAALGIPRPVGRRSSAAAAIGQPQSVPQPPTPSQPSLHHRLFTPIRVGLASTIGRPPSCPTRPNDGANTLPANPSACSPSLTRRPPATWKISHRGA